jgi:UDP-3-O-[3-hydroxymyristoyl] glucosamine N-acyltransferase
MSFITEHNKKYENFRPFNYRPKTSWTIANHYPNTMIGTNVEIGAGTIIYPNVTIYDNVTIGQDCVIDAGAVIGAEGFSIHYEDGKWVDMKNVGGVKIGDNVKIGANTCIDRASLENAYTIIEKFVKIDNLCHVAHNVVIGEGSVLCPQVCVGGSTVIGQGVWLGIGAILREHITVDDFAFVCMGSVVTGDVESGTRVAGYYAMNSNRWKSFVAAVRSGDFWKS